ncbi:hypothetical protein, partial [Rheinheimera sp.]|uniref:hypothetical protein n=1 Tax=Rheinheimera sp. TaxID=1869214 RepID=UPI00307EC0EA
VLFLPTPVMLDAAETLQEFSVALCWCVIEPLFLLGYFDIVCFSDLLAISDLGRCTGPELGKDSALSKRGNAR